MRRLWYRFVYRLTTDDNWRWLTLAGLTAVLFLIGIVLLPYALTQPGTNYERAARELYEFAGLRYGARGVFDGLLGGLSWIVWGLFGVALVATIVYFFPAFWDDVRRGVETIRVRMWDRYGAEIRNRGFFTRLLLGHNPPPGSSPPATPAEGQPLTTGTFLLGETLINFVNEFIGHRLWGR